MSPVRQNLRIQRSWWWRLFNHLAPRLLRCCIPLMFGSLPICLSGTGCSTACSSCSEVFGVCIRTPGKQQALGGKRGCVATCWSNRIGKSLSWRVGYFLTASCYALLRAFSQNRFFVKGKRSLNRVLCITAAGSPHSLEPVLPQQPVTLPWESTDGDIPSSETLLLLLHVLMCS